MNNGEAIEMSAGLSLRPRESGMLLPRGLLKAIGDLNGDCRKNSSKSSVDARSTRRRGVSKGDSYGLDGAEMRWRRRKEGDAL